MATPARIGNVGERHVVAWLHANGWACNHNTQLPGSTDIEAMKGVTRILVQVKTSVIPNFPATLSADEYRRIVARARQSGRQAWLAQVVINTQGAQVGKINWNELK